MKPFGEKLISGHVLGYSVDSSAPQVDVLCVNANYFAPGKHPPEYIPDLGLGSFHYYYISLPCKLLSRVQTGNVQLFFNKQQELLALLGNI